MKYYTATIDLKLQSLTYVGLSGKSHKLMSDEGEIIILSNFAFGRLSPSRITVLRDLEELLRLRYVSVSEELKLAGVSFDDLSFSDKTAVLKKDAKEVYQYTLSGQFIQRFPSVSSAAYSLGRGNANIFRMLRGGTPAAYGFRWSYHRYEKLPAYKKAPK